MKSNSLKKLLSVVLLLMMIVSMLPSAAFAEEAQPADEPVVTEQTVKAEENKDEVKDAPKDETKDEVKDAPKDETKDEVQDASKTATVIYHANGGTSTTDSVTREVDPSTYTVETADNVGFTAPDDNKELAFWADSETVTETTTRYPAGGGITNVKPGETLELYAQWRDTTPVEPNWLGLSISKTVDKAFAMPGDTITYTITVLNNTPDDLTDVVIYDELPSEVTYVSHTVNPLTPAEVTRVEDNYIIEMLGDCTTVEFTITATVNDNVPIGTEIVNEARVSRANGYQSPGHTPMDSATTVVVKDPDWLALSITRDVDKTTTKPGDTLTYTITVKNNTGADFRYVQILYTLLPIDMVSVDSTKLPEGATYDAAAGTVKVTIDSLAAGAEKVITIPVTVLPEATGTIKNTAKITYAISDSSVKATEKDLEDKTASVETPIVTEAEPVEMPVNVIVNFDGLDAATKLPAGYALTGADANELLKGSITLTRDEAADTAVYTGKVSAVPGKDYNLSFIHTGFAVDGYICTSSANQQVTVIADKEKGVVVDLTLKYIKGLTITKTADKTYATPGSYVKYTITVTNKTGVDLTNVNVLDYLPDEVRYSSSFGGYNSSNSTWTIASLADGKSATATIRVRINSGLSTGTKIENTAYVTEVTVAGQKCTFDKLWLNDTAVVTVTGGKGAPKTGDESNLGLWIAVMAASLACAGAAVVVYKKRRTGND